MFGTFSGGGLGMGVAFTLKDQFSATAAKIKKELSGLGDWTDKVSKKIGNAQRQMQSGFKFAMAGGLLAAPFLIGVNRVAMLSDKLGDVRKTTGLAGEELEQLQKKLNALNTRTTFEDLLDISAIGGQLGIAKNQIGAFTEAVDKAVVALGDEFTGGAQQVASELGKISQVFKETKALKVDDSLIRIGSSLNALAAAGSATAPAMSDFTRRVGEMGVLAPTVQETMGLAAAVEELGMGTELAASGFKNFVKVAGNHVTKFAAQIGVSDKAFKKMFNESTNETLIKVAKSFKGMSNIQAIQTMKSLGLRSNETMGLILNLANNTDLLIEKQKLSNAEFTKGTSLLNEFGIKNETLGARIAKMKKRFMEILVIFGEVAVPIFEKVAYALMAVVNVFKKIAENPIGAFILKVVFSLGLLLTVVGTAMIVFGGLRLMLYRVALAFGVAKAANIQYALASGRVGIALRLMVRYAWQSVLAIGKGMVGALAKAGGLLLTFGGGLFNAGKAIIAALIPAIASAIPMLVSFAAAAWAAILPLLPFIAIGVAVGLVIYGIYKAAKWVYDNIAVIFNFIGSVISAIWSGIKAVVGVVWEVGKAVATAIWNGLKSVGSAIWNFGKSVVTTVWGGIKSVWNGFKSAVSSLFSNIWSGIKSVASAAWEFGKGVVGSIWGGIKSAWGSIFGGLPDLMKQTLNKESLTAKFNGIVTGSASSDPSGVIGQANEAKKAEQTSRVANTFGWMEKNKAQTGSTHKTIETRESVKNINVTLEMEGEVVAKKIIDKFTIWDARE